MHYFFHGPESLSISLSICSSSLSSLNNSWVYSSHLSNFTLMFGITVPFFVKQYAHQCQLILELFYEGDNYHFLSLVVFLCTFLHTIPLCTPYFSSDFCINALIDTFNSLFIASFLLHKLHISLVIPCHPLLSVNYLFLFQNIFACT